MTNDQLDQFKQFMDFIQNVGAYKQVIVDVQKATKEYNEAAKILAQGQTVTNLQRKLEEAQARFKQDMQDAQASLDKQVQMKTGLLASKEASLGMKEASLLQKERDLDQRELALKKQESLMQDVTDMVDQQKKEIMAKSMDLQQREGQLASKASQIQQLLG